MLQEKALKFSSARGIPNFNASNGWLGQFRVRHSIVFRAFCGGRAEVNQDVESDWKSRLSVITSAYCDRDIDKDEAGLFFKLIPDKTLTVNAGQCRGGKTEKQGSTFGLCANLYGEKEEPAEIHTANRASKPVAFPSKTMTFSYLVSLGIQIKMHD
ncbi:tigger transposable element-derived protein 6-like [Schistocerca serialis cubense]|uniref:tigger transposable element-derived protein 6-like n=1 Tax=Schistocerca serialis cubense TaxID=2023355 RepID=UPI00214E292E|nr:tigger transposable element-derived protein 6-like [Schistocerca serialis cubense]